MTTKNSFNAAPVEPIGDADNALNVTTVETAAECAEVVALITSGPLHIIDRDRGRNLSI